MNRFAMVLKNRVIDIVEQEEKPYYPPDPEGNPINAVPCGAEVEIGWIYENGVFKPYETEPTPTEEPHLTEMEQSILETAINVDYLVCLADLGI